MLYICYSCGEHDFLYFVWVSAADPLAAAQAFGRALALEPKPEVFPRGDYWAHVYAVPDEAVVRAEQEGGPQGKFARWRYSMAVGSDGRTEVYADDGDGDLTDAPPPVPPKRRRARKG